MAWWQGWWGPGWGWGRGWGWRGRGGGWAWWVAPQMISAAASRGYRYIGPCRSGIGPWAFYISPSGQIVHAWQIFSSNLPISSWPWGWIYPTTTPVSTREELEREREFLRKELQEIERRIKELEGSEK